MPVPKLFRTFIKDRRGYVAVVFGILALPLIGIAGAAIDYRNIGREYNNLRAAAEAAAVAAARAEFKVDDPGAENSSTLANKVFDANYTVDPNKVINLTRGVSETNTTDRSITFSAAADAKTSLLQVIGFSSFRISVSAKAAAIFSSSNVQVHFVFDMSPSMGAPDDGTAPPLVYQVSGGDGCFFMCHDDGTAIRNAGKTPKMDTIINALDATDGTGFVKTLGDAAAADPIPITMKFSGHYFDHHFHQNAYFTTQRRDNAITQLQAMLAGSHYVLGLDGVNGGTDLKTSFEELHTYLSSTSPPPANTRRIIVIISDGMHARAKQPFDPAVCTALRPDGDIYTLHIKMPESVYRNPNLNYVVPGGTYGGMQAVDTWDWTVLLNGGSSPYGYYSGLNNAATLMSSCATKTSMAYEAETGAQIRNALQSMAQVIISPTIRVIN
jgi:Flp pilus assembly protein TadG